MAGEEKVILEIRMPVSALPAAHAAIVALAANLNQQINNGEVVLQMLVAGEKLPALTPIVGQLALNLDLLRIECGWSYDALHEATGISKKLSIGHIRHGHGATPRNLRLYAEAFSKRLQRAVTARDLST
jgi:hypothetical protein